VLIKTRAWRKSLVKQHWRDSARRYWQKNFFMDHGCCTNDWGWLALPLAH
jgi:hypothetical protein